MNNRENTVKQMWMVRAGRGATHVDALIENESVAIGWAAAGEISPKTTRREVTEILSLNFPDISKGKLAISAGQVYRFLSEIRKGDSVLTYDHSRRIYHVGEIVSDPYFDEKLIGGLPRCRKVKWLGEVSRDKISISTRNSLGAISTLFLLPEDATLEMESRLRGDEPQSQTDTDIDSESESEVTDLIAQDLRAQSREFIKDNISKLDWDEMQELVAGLLRAMGYKTRVSPSGSDRGKDIIASPDGFGFEQPRIVVEVKHRPNTAMGSGEIRSFLGGRHSDDKGLYVSTGGFTKDALYEAERASIPIVLLDLDGLVKEIIRHYASFDVEAKSLVPMTNIYWPA